MSDSKKHCVVIGAGIVGSSCAWHLRRKGMEVTLIDRVEPGMSCSFGNAACVSPSSVVPFSYPGMINKVPGWMLDPLGPVRVRPRDFPGLLPWFWKFWRVSSMQKVEQISSAQKKLMDTVFKDYGEILSATDSTHLYRSKGSIHLYDTEKEYQKDLWQIELRRKMGYDSHRLSAAELKKLVPELKFDNGVAMMMPDWHQVLNPQKVTQRIAENSFGDGTKWVNDEVSKVDSTDQGIVVTTASGSKINADKLVVAAGAWSNKVAGWLDYTVPLVAKRGYHSMIANPGIELDLPVMSLTKMFVMTPLNNGLRLAGTAEFAALDAEPDYRRAKVLLKHAAHYLEGLQTEGVTEWMGPRPMMSDSMPIISASPGHRHVFYAFGHGHYGLTQGPTTGRHIASLVAGETPTVDLTPFRFDRFKKP